MLNGMTDMGGNRLFTKLISFSNPYKMLGVKLSYQVMISKQGCLASLTLHHDPCTWSAQR